MTVPAGARGAARTVIVRCRRCGEWDRVPAPVAYARVKPRCDRCGGWMFPTTGQGDL